VEQEKVRPVPVLEAFLVIVVTFFLGAILGTLFLFVLGEGPALFFS
jgi:hypothetical protein